MNHWSKRCQNRCGQDQCERMRGREKLIKNRGGFCIHIVSKYQSSHFTEYHRLYVKCHLCKKRFEGILVDNSYIKEKPY